MDRVTEPAVHGRPALQRRLLCALALAAAGVLVLALVWLSAAPTAQADPGFRYVATTGTDGGNNCTNPADPCRTIQHAIDVSSPADEIRVAGGNYSRVGTVAEISQGVSIVGGYAPGFGEHNPDVHRTVLDAGWGGAAISITNAGEVLLLHLTVTRGDGQGNCPDVWSGCGGGIYAVETGLHVGQCVISNNVGSSTEPAYGGGMYVSNRLHGAPVHIWGSQFLSNTASLADVGWGGGAFLETGGPSAPSLVEGNLFQGNTGSSVGWGQGGGLYLQHYATVSGNLFQNNHASRGAGQVGQGGGLYLWNGWGITVQRNRFLNNTASGTGYGYGGAVYGSSSVMLTMTNNLLAGNHASTAGGGVWLNTWASYHIAATLVNNTLANNAAGAGGEGMWLGSYVALTLTNNLISGHTVGVTNTAPASSTVSADTNLFWDTSDPIVGSNAVQQHPQLTTDYHIRPTSPAVDAGLALAWLTEDLDGDLRPQGDGIDLGAYEVAMSYLPVALRNHP